MSESPIEPDTERGADEGQGEDFDPVQTGEPATGPEAPVPPGGQDLADQPGS
ncbi:hypothetical protein GEV29_01800 [Aeromicrobium sp. SMF47]|uniref:Uncharacterized protein n=1 Tax=Aeromicrobium yanjiei TaxID=2662028 RepID=A0A5Q2MGV5_9ACTN|nr:MULTISPECIES: hypothetical protein [Aeromicrobium]MRJ75262.1 hypothetical protein [Aeromicrobium yanjiei]MRK02680.1 hypothetical protein [Aeromicrobium sp. S22]QGG40276.1 hypothetical protein GEV26_02205 [Aeromicrobium yanjiei]